MIKLQEQFGGMMGGFRTARTYFDDVMSNIKRSLEHKFHISEKSWSSLDKLWADIDKIYWSQQSEIAPFIKSFESKGKRAEYCSEAVIDKYYNEYKFTQADGKFGQYVNIKVPYIIHPDYVWFPKCNGSAKLINQEIQPRTDGNLGASVAAYKFRLVGVEPAEIELVNIQTSTKKIVKKYVYKIYVSTK